jgi:DNA-binding CsgD family transcriptional regulator
MIFNKSYTCTLLSIALICIGFNLKGQKVETKEAIDSLYKSATSLSTAHQDSVYSIANKIFSESNKLNYERGIIKSKILASYYFINQFKLDTAKYLLLQCETFYQNNPDEKNTLDHGSVLYYQSTINMRLQNYQLSEQQAQHALEIYTAIESAESKKNRGFVFRQLGKIEQLRDNSFKALHYFLQAYTTLLNAGVPPSNTASTLNSIAEICIKLGQYEKALIYAKKSNAALRDNEHSQLAGLQTIADIYVRAEKYDSALYYYTLSKNLALKNNLSALVRSADYNIARVYTALGKTNQSMQLLSNLQSNNTPPHTGMNKHVHYLLASNYLTLKNYDSSIYYGNQAYKAAFQTGPKQLIISTSKILSNAYKHIGKNDSALYYLTINNSYNDSLYNIENQSKLSSLYAELETLEKQKEIQLLVKEQSIQQAKNKRLEIIISSVILAGVFVIIILILSNKYRIKKQKLMHTQLMQELEQKKHDLQQQTARIKYINTCLAQVEAALKGIKTKFTTSTIDTQRMLNTIQINRILDKEWQNFNTYFGNSHEGFLAKISMLFPGLTVTEKRLAALIKMNLSNPEIASLLNTEPSSVKVAKHRLKKKLHLTEEQDISLFLQNLEQNIQHLHQN